MSKLLNLKDKVKTFDELFETTSESGQAKGDVIQIDIDSLEPFPDHPFKLYTGEKLDKMVDSIKKLGIITPIAVKKAGEAYQILSGHNRVNAAKIAGLKHVRAVILDVDEDTAAIIVVESNFRQREELLPSERAFAYKMKMDAINRRGKCIDLTEQSTGEKSRDKLGKETGDSGFQVQRYLRLIELIQEFLKMVDDKKIGFNTGVELSWLDKQRQKEVLDIAKENNIKIKLKQAMEMKKKSQEGLLTYEEAVSILCRQDTGRTEIKLKFDDLSKYFPEDSSDEEIINTIIKALDNLREK